MICRTQHLSAFFAAFALVLFARAQAPEPWVFEGLITESDPALAPDLQSGWVLSGSFLLNTLEMDEQFADEDTRSGRIVGGITEGELTVDLYYQVLFEATQQPGLAGFDYQDNNLEENGRDLFGWFFPLTGKLGETNWTSAWLQIWLMDPEGKMISHVPVKISPYGIDWKSGWFRLTFKDENGESVHADGRINIFSPESKVEEADSSPWYAVAAELSRQLMQRDGTIKLLQNELTEVKSRLEGLRRMVDLLVEERASLQEDNALLREKAEAADPEMLNKLAELTAEKSLLETRIEDLSGENDSLQGELNRSEQERFELLQTLKDLEIQMMGRESLEGTNQLSIESIESVIPEAVLLPPVPESVPAEPQMAEPSAPEPVVIETIQEPVAESLVLESPSVESPVVEEQVEPVPEKEENQRKLLPRRRGPRKFR